MGGSLKVRGWVAAPSWALLVVVLATVAAFVTEETWAEGATEGDGAPIVAPEAADESLAGHFFEVAPTVSGEVATEGTGEEAFEDAALPPEAAYYMEENAGFPWTRRELRRWAKQNSAAIAAAQMVSAVEQAAPPTLSELFDAAIAQAEAASGGPVSNQSSSVLGGSAAQSLAPPRTKAQGFFRKLDQRTNPSVFINRNGDGGPVGVFAANLGEGELAIIYEMVMPFRLNDATPLNEGEGEGCRAVVGSGYYRFRIRDTGEGEGESPFEFAIHLEHVLTDVGALVFYDSANAPLLTLACGASPWEYVLDEAERTTLFSATKMRLFEDGETPPGGLLAEGARWWSGSMIQCPIDMPDPELTTGGGCTSAMLFDPLHLDLFLNNIMPEVPLSWSQRGDRHIHGLDDTITLDLGAAQFSDYHYFTLEELAAIWGPGAFDYLDMHYTASGRPNARFVGTPACDAATGMVFSVPVDLLAVIPAEGETAEGHILGQVMMLLHPSAAHTSLHLDLSGVIGAQDVLLLDANGDTLFTYPVYGLRFDHIFTPCEEDGLDNVRAIAVSNAEQPNGAWREDPEWANEEGEVEGEGEVGGDCFGYECFYPGCELDWDVTIDYPGEVPPATVALVAMLPYGWTYAGAATNEGFTPPATVDESNQGLSIFFWNQPISFPFTTRLQLLPNGNPGDTQIGMRILIHDIIYSVNGEDYYSGAQFTALLSAPLPAPEEGSPECVSANPTAAATIDDPYPDTSIYYSGCDVNLDLAINYEGNDAVTALGLTVSLPDGWSYAGAATGSEYFPPPIPANTGATGTVGFAWIDVPEFPFTTRLTFDTSEADTGVVETLAYEVLYRTTGAGFSPLQQEKRYFGVALQAADCPSASGDIVDVTQGARWSGGGAPTCPNYAYSADLNGDYIIQLTELLRVIQFYNSLGYHCDDVPSDTEDGFVPGPGTNHTCNPYDTDYNPTDWVISLTELLRLIQFYNSLGYHFCPLADSEDGFCPGAFQSWSRILGTDGRDSGGQLALINEGDDILVAFSGRPSKTMLQLELIDSTKRVHPHVARVNEAGDIVGSQGIVAMSYIQGSEVGAFNVLPDASGYLLGTRMPSANYTGNMKKLGSLIGTTVNGYDSLSSLPIASAVPITSTTIAYVATPYPDVLASSNTPSRVAYVDTEDELNNWTDQSFGPKHPIYDLVLLPESATRRLVGVGAGPNANDQMQAELTAFDLQNQVARMGHFVFENGTDQSELRAVSLAAEDRLIVVGSRFVTDHFEVLAAVTDLEGNVSAELTGTWVKSFSCMRSQWARDVIKTTDGGFLIVGHGVRETGGNDMQLLLLETDADGNENAVRRLCGGIQNDYGLSVARYGADEGILVGGTTESTTGFAELGGESVSGENDVLLMKLPPCGI